MNRLIRLCKENQIQLILVSFPGSGVLEKEIQNKEKMHEFFADIANEYDITYYALEEEKKGQLFLNDKFKDYLHLNKNGADLFSSMLCEQFWENEV